jgi:hypothetical protein
LTQHFEFEGAAEWADGDGGVFEAHKDDG